MARGEGGQDKGKAKGKPKLTTKEKQDKKKEKAKSKKQIQRTRKGPFLIMHNYKIGLLIFSNTKSQGPPTLQMVETNLKKTSFGIVKAVQIVDRNPALISPLMEDYKNTNLGMIVLIAPEADNFFPFQDLEEVGVKNEKFLVTLNLDEHLEENFLQMIEKVKAMKGKPRKGCDASCR